MEVDRALQYKILEGGYEVRILGTEPVVVAPNWFYGASESTNLTAEQVAALTSASGSSLTATVDPAGAKYIFVARKESEGAIGGIYIAGNPTNQASAWIGDNGTFTSPRTLTVNGTSYRLYRSPNLVNVAVQRTWQSNP